MPEGEFDQLPLEFYLDGSYETAELQWRTEIDLRPGTVMRFYHPDSQKSYIFESLEPTASKFANGLLTIMDGDEIIEERIAAEICLLHPIAPLAQTNTPHVEFNVAEKDGVRRRIHPPLKFADVMFCEDLAEQVRQSHVNNELKRPFEDESSRQTLKQLIEYYESVAEACTDQVKAWLMRRIVDQLKRDFDT